MHKSQWTEHGGKKPHSKLWEVVLCQEKKNLLVRNTDNYLGILKNNSILIKYI